MSEERPTSLSEDELLELDERIRDYGELTGGKQCKELLLNIRTY
jgi:hypothetical protein